MEWLKRYETNRKFTLKEAWMVFRLAAVAESIGWTLLIIALIISHYQLFAHAYAVPIAGQIHGTFFIVYFIVILSVYPSLNWSRMKLLLACLAGVVPFGSLALEIWQSKHLPGYSEPINVFALIPYQDLIIAVQPKHGDSWQLPGGEVNPGESKKQAITRILKTQFGITPKLKILSDRCFLVTNSIDYHELQLNKLDLKNTLVDDIGRLNRIEAPELFNQANLLAQM